MDFAGWWAECSGIRFCINYQLSLFLTRLFRLPFVIMDKIDLSTSCIDVLNRLMGWWTRWFRDLTCTSFMPLRTPFTCTIPVLLPVLPTYIFYFTCVANTLPFICIIIQYLLQYIPLLPPFYFIILCIPTSIIFYLLLCFFVHVYSNIFCLLPFTCVRGACMPVTLIPVPRGATFVRLFTTAYARSAALPCRTRYVVACALCMRVTCCCHTFVAVTVTLLPTVFTYNALPFWSAFLRVAFAPSACRTFTRYAHLRYRYRAFYLFYHFAVRSLFSTVVIRCVVDGILPCCCSALMPPTWPTVTWCCSFCTLPRCCVPYGACRYTITAFYLFVAVILYVALFLLMLFVLLPALFCTARCYTLFLIVIFTVMIHCCLTTICHSIVTLLLHYPSFCCCSIPPARLLVRWVHIFFYTLILYRYSPLFTCLRSLYHYRGRCSAPRCLPAVRWCWSIPLLRFHLPYVSLYIPFTALHLPALVALLLFVHTTAVRFLVPIVVPYLFYLPTFAVVACGVFLIVTVWLTRYCRCFITLLPTLYVLPWFVTHHHYVGAALPLVAARSLFLLPTPFVPLLCDFNILLRLRLYRCTFLVYFVAYRVTTTTAFAFYRCGFTLRCGTRWPFVSTVVYRCRVFACHTCCWFCIRYVVVMVLFPHYLLCAVAAPARAFCRRHCTHLVPVTTLPVTPHTLLAVTLPVALAGALRFIYPVTLPLRSSVHCRVRSRAVVPVLLYATVTLWCRSFALRCPCYCPHTVYHIYRLFYGCYHFALRFSYTFSPRCALYVVLYCYVALPLPLPDLLWFADSGRSSAFLIYVNIALLIYCWLICHPVLRYQIPYTTTYWCYIALYVRFVAVPCFCRSFTAVALHYMCCCCVTLLYHGCSFCALVRVDCVTD